MNDESLLGLCLALLLWLAVSIVFLGTSTQDSVWQKEAIEHGAAQYSPVTGEFEWLGEE